MACRTILLIAMSITNFGVSTETDCSPVPVKPEQLNSGNIVAMHQVSVYTLTDCVRACRTEPGCGAFQFHRHTGCYLFHEDSSSANGSVVSSNLSGMFISDLWRWNVGPCSGHTCAEDEYCNPTGANYVCKKAYDVCYKHLPQKMCFKRFEGFKFDLFLEHNLEINTLVRNAMECVTFCAIHQPTFTSLAYVANPSKCYCKNASITDFSYKTLAELANQSEEVDIYFKIL